MSTYNSWSPLFDSIVYSSLWDEPYYVRILFLTMLAIKDRDHIVRRNAYALRKLANITDEEIMLALEVLKMPDTRRGEHQEFEGRRIKEVKEGWLILNGEKYRELLITAKKREQKRVAEQIRRSKRSQELEKLRSMNGKPLPGEMAYVKAVEEGDDEMAERMLRTAGERAERRLEEAAEQMAKELAEDPPSLE